ncbi:MAG: AbrB/MazE/SpoVT family DNA-binding domain-containing protein [bacterium]
MNTKINAWGNSLAVRIPKNILDELKLKENDSVTVERENNCIRIRPAKKRLKLSDLVDKIKPSNLHAEIETEEGFGNEAW